MGLGLAHLKTPLRASHLKGNKNSLRRTAPFSVRFFAIEGGTSFAKGEGKAGGISKIFENTCNFFKKVLQYYSKYSRRKRRFPFLPQGNAHEKSLYRLCAVLVSTENDGF